MAPENEAVGGAGPKKLQVTKIVEGDIMCLRFIGTIDEEFSGKAQAESVSGTLILDLGEVARISSFGIREWVDFIKEAGTKAHAIYFIECSPKIIDQFNMVANFGGPGKILSFYAPYRCDYCDDDRRRLVQVDESYDLIQNLALPDVPCESCGNKEYFDEEPTSFFTHLAQQAKFEPDPAVANFLAAKLDYRVSAASRRLRVDKVVEEATFVKLAGDLDVNFPREKLAEGLEGDVVFDVSAVGRIDDEGAREWTAFMQVISSHVSHLYLRDCPPGFVERLFTPEALAGKAEVISFFMPFKCPKCATSAAQRVMTEEHYDVLKFATSPEFTCSECGTKAPSVASDEFMACLGNLIKPSVPKEIIEFAAQAHEKLVKPAQPAAAAVPMMIGELPRAGRTVGIATFAAVLASLIVVGGLGFLAWRQLRKEEQIRYDEGGKVVEQSHKQAPPWLKEWENKMVEKVGDTYYFIGYSSAVKEREEGPKHALDDALERYVHETALATEDATFKETVIKQYRSVRDAAMEKLKKAMDARDGVATIEARKALWAHRAAVTAALRATALDVPKEGESFWQRLKTSDGTRWRFWTRIAVPKAKIMDLAKQYTGSTTAQGVTATNYFPGLAWLYPSMRAGAVVVSVAKDSKWLNTGLSAGTVVTECDKRAVKSAREFTDTIERVAKMMTKDGGRLECSASNQGQSRPLGYEIAKFVEEPMGPKIIYTGGGMKHTGTGAGDVNVWDDPSK
jgi:anti-anti-sigma regulatory factor